MTRSLDNPGFRLSRGNAKHVPREGRSCGAPRHSLGQTRSRFLPKRRTVAWIDALDAYALDDGSAMASRVEVFSKQEG